MFITKCSKFIFLKFHAFLLPLKLVEGVAKGQTRCLEAPGAECSQGGSEVSFRVIYFW